MRRRASLTGATRSGVGPALDQLLSVRMLSTVLRGTPLEVRLPGETDPVVTGIAEHEYGEEDIAELDTHERFLKLVCELQAWLGRPLEPPARPTEEDAAELGRALALIRQPQRRGTWSEVMVTLADKPPPAEAFQVAILEPVYATLFGSRVYLGIDLISLQAAYVASADANDVRLLPADEEASVVVTLQHPDLAPSDAAQPRAAEGHGRVLVDPSVSRTLSRRIDGRGDRRRGQRAAERGRPGLRLPASCPAQRKSPVRRMLATSCVRGNMPIPCASARISGARESKVSRSTPTACATSARVPASPNRRRATCWPPRVEGTKTLQLDGQSESPQRDRDHGELHERCLRLVLTGKPLRITVREPAEGA